MHAELTESQAYLVLNALPNMGPITLNRLLEALGNDPRKIFQAGAPRLGEVRGVGPAIIGTIANWTEHFNVAREEEWMARAGTNFINSRDRAYPALLLEIPDPPIGLYRKGHYSDDAPAIAIVGSRRTTLYGQATARKLGAELAQAGFCVVSGLARGIDTAAHEGALSVGGRTVAVVGQGIDIVYPPENLDLYRRIEASGAIYSEFPFGRRADRQSFAMRNRIVAGLSAGVIVVESDVAGGSMITARFAGEQGRLIFAVPGRIDQATSAGCHQLIRDGATLLTSVDDLLSELNYLGGMRPGAIPPKAGDVSAAGAANLSEAEARVYAAFAGGALNTPDAVAAATGLGAGEISAALMMLELKRLIAKRADGTFEARA